MYSLNKDRQGESKGDGWFYENTKCLDLVYNNDDNYLDI